MQTARPEIELILRKAFRARSRKRVRREAMIWATAVAAIMVMMVSINRKPPVVSPQPAEAQARIGTGAPGRS